MSNTGPTPGISSHPADNKMSAGDPFQGYKRPGLEAAHSTPSTAQLNPLNAELNPICHLLALLGGATIVVVSRLRVNERSCISIPLHAFTTW